MVGSRRLLPMTGYAVGVEFCFAHLKLGRRRATPDGLFGLRGIAGHKETHDQEPYSDVRP